MPIALRVEAVFTWRRGEWRAVPARGSCDYFRISAPGAARPRQGRDVKNPSRLLVMVSSLASMRERRLTVFGTALTVARRTHRLEDRGDRSEVFTDRDDAPGNPRAETPSTLPGASPPHGRDDRNSL